MGMEHYNCLQHCKFVIIFVKRSLPGFPVVPTQKTLQNQYVY